MALQAFRRNTQEQKRNACKIVLSLCAALVKTQQKRSLQDAF